jgi:hypothetical protein
VLATWVDGLPVYDATPQAAATKPLTPF